MSTFGSNQSGQSGQTNTPTVNYGTPAIKVGNVVRDGDEFVLLTKGPKDQSYQIWSSTDQRQTEQLFKNASKQLVGMSTVTT